MQPGFHARKSALSRRYRYDIGLDESSSSPFRRPYEWALGRELDLDLLRATARLIHGEHDFRAFAVKGNKSHYRCRLGLADWEPRSEGRGVSFQVEADRFLHHMVRFLVGTMVDVALGRRPVDDVADLLRREDNNDTSPPAPPQGLYFVAVSYPPELFVDPVGEPRAAAYLG
jgi:tRNA pseudouridine38-40 synthase